MQVSSRKVHTLFFAGSTRDKTPEYSHGVRQTIAALFNSTPGARYSGSVTFFCKIQLLQKQANLVRKAREVVSQSSQEADLSKSLAADGQQPSCYSASSRSAGEGQVFTIPSLHWQGSLRTASCVQVFGSTDGPYRTKLWCKKWAGA